MAGQLKRRGERTWLCRVYLGADSQTGKRRYLNKTIHGTKNDAQKWLNDALLRKDMGELVEASTMLMSEFLERWLETSVRLRVREASYATYRGIVKYYIVPALGGKRLADIRPVDIQALYVKLGKTKAAATVRIVHSTLVTAFKQAVRWQMLRSSPMSHVDGPRRDPKESKWLAIGEARRFLEAAKGDDLEALFAFALVSGCRPAEYLGLKWQDVDFATGLVTIQRNLVRRRNGDYYFSEPKTARSRRTLVLGVPLLKKLSDVRQRQNENRMRNRDVWNRLDLVFTNEIGSPLSFDSIRRRYKVVLERAGLPRDVKLYALRHSCASLLMTQGINPKIVSERLGHSDVGITLGIYTHVAPGLQEQVSKGLEDALFG
jgi:integrase